MQVWGLPTPGLAPFIPSPTPLGGKYGVSHGLANTIMLPHVMAFNLPGALEKFAINRRDDGRVGR